MAGWLDGEEGVYPRVCGGTWRVALSSLPVLGLSPRVRGNRGSGAGVSIPGRVYPRVCGGTPDVIIEPNVPEGLSPRVRGNPLEPPRQEPILRSIPACAGEPSTPADAVVPESVYPRVCGGTRYGVLPYVR